MSWVGFWDFIVSLILEWYITIIATVVGMILVWVMGLLPSRYQFHKRLNFALKVKKAVSKIDVSVQTRSPMDTITIQKELKKFFAQNSIEEIKSSKTELTFFSNETSGNYVISCTNDEETDNHFMIISCLNAFNIGKFGGISGLKDMVNEIQEILDSLGNIRKNKDNLTVQITITPRWKFLQDKGIEVRANMKNVYTSYTIKSIKVVNKGTANIKENVYEGFYDWMVSLL